MHRLSLFLLSVFCINTAVLAHPGHGHPAVEDTVFHYLTTPVHLAALLLTTLSLLLTVYSVRRIVLSYRAPKSVRLKVSTD